LANHEEFRLEKNLVDFNENFSFYSFEIKNYKPIQSDTVAKALEQLAKNETAGFNIYNSAEIENIVNS
jgi:hypothetical protein